MLFEKQQRHGKGNHIHPYRKKNIGCVSTNQGCKRLFYRYRCDGNDNVIDIVID